MPTFERLQAIETLDLEEGLLDLILPLPAARAETLIAAR